MNVDRDLVRMVVPPILAACVVSLIVGLPPDDHPSVDISRALAGATP